MKTSRNDIFKMPFFRKKRKSAGNALFLILIAVALFAALSYAVTRSGGGSGGGADRERDGLKAAHILQMSALVQKAVQTVTLLNGCNIDAISEVAFVGNPASNPGPCNIWDKDSGGGLAYTLAASWPWNPVPAGLQPYFSTLSGLPEGTKAHFINSMNVRGTASTRVDAVMLFFNITEGICKAVNRQLGIVTADGLPPLEDTPYEGGWDNPYGGAVHGPGNWGMIIGESQTTSPSANELNGHLEGCFRATRPTLPMGYHFYSVIGNY